MIDNLPKAGQIFDYHYLWKWQDEKGETEGRKRRPVCMVLTVVNSEGNHVLFIVPITSKKPTSNRIAISIPEIEAHRANLDTTIPLWIIVDELNVDILETSYTLESRTPRGQFGSAFTDAVLIEIRNVRKMGKVNISKRT